MERLVCIAGSSDVEEGTVVAVEVNGHEIAIARSRGCVYAFEDHCSHQDCKLSTGFVEDGVIECEHHGAMFDLASGDVLLPPALEPIQVFASIEDDSGILVDINEIESFYRSQ